MIAMGLILHPGAYFRVPWNLLDFVIVVTSLASLAADVNIVALRSLRLLRVLRPLRLISYFKVRRLVAGSTSPSKVQCGELSTLQSGKLPFLVKPFLFIKIALRY